jgi:hypothetical protein
MKIPFKEVLEMIEWLHDDMGLSSVVTGTELAALLAETLVSVRDPFCTTCDVNTMEVGEYYMVDHALWNRYGVGKGMMCIGCLEDRLGRELVSSDFSDVPINTMDTDLRSKRLKARLGLL